MGFLSMRPAQFIRSGHLVLRSPMATDYAQWADLRERSQTFLRPWEPSWAPDELSRPAFRRRLRHWRREAAEDTGHAFFILVDDDRTLAGGINLAHVRRGVTQSAQVGYWMGEGFAGRGLMTEALGALIPWCFGPLGLHRLEAACVPHNDRSRRVLLRTGFREEGHARQYLKIDGQWHDHILFGMLASDPRPASPQPQF